MKKTKKQRLQPTMSKNQYISFSHNGIDIIMAINGLFSADINGVRIVRPLLAAMKKFIDSQKKFEPFNALNIDGSTVRIVGVKKKIGRFGTKYYWISDRPSCPLSFVCADTPANRKAIAEYNKHEAKTEKLMDECNKKTSLLEGKIIKLIPGNE